MMIVFDSKIYSESAIQAAIRAFEDIATIHMAFCGNDIICSVLASSYDQELTCFEFANAVLEYSVIMDGLK